LPKENTPLPLKENTPFYLLEIWADLSAAGEFFPFPNPSGRFLRGNSDFEGHMKFSQYTPERKYPPFYLGSDLPKGGYFLSAIN